MNRIAMPSFRTAMIPLVLMVCSFAARGQRAQESSPSTREPDFNRHLDELTNKLDSMRQQLIDSQNEMDELRRELHTLREQLSEKDQSVTAERDAEALRSSVTQLQDETEVLQEQVKQHDQSKVESSSKYPVRVNGVLLVTSILNTASSDDFNLPTVAVPKTPYSRSGSLSESASQTMLGLDASGPHFLGAKSFADLSVDFWGSATAGNYGASGGTVRLRTAHARLEWPSRSFGVAYDRPLLSPWQPTSWVTMAEPAFSWSGNLWTWSPQIQFRQSGVLKHLNIDLGLIDPGSPGSYIAGASAASASERSRQPGYESRIGFESTWSGHPINLGASGYYSRQDYLYGHTVDAWAGAADWNLGITRQLQFSGQFYRGRGIGGLGGGAFKDYVTNATTHHLLGVNAIGGWAQAKVTISPSLEVNFSTGMDNAYAADLQGSEEAAAPGYYSSLARNQTWLANLVYRPKSYLLLSTEFRQINSRSSGGVTSQDRVVGVATGYIF